MMHSRGFVLSENQAFAGQTRTPGPSRLHASPTRKTMTTGKRALGQSSNLFGQEMGSAGPKQLFQDLMSNKSPVKALGDRNAAKTPGASRSAAPGKQDASLGKGKGADNSPTKKGSGELSPRKASTSNALRSINGKQRQNVDLPFTKPGQDSTNDAGGNNMIIKTPAPTQLNGKTRTMSRQNSFVTPAANIGRAGQIKARMGEILDAEMGLSLQKADNATEQATEEPAVQMTEEEMYPEIEYMPPSAKHPVFEFPAELDDLPRAKEIGARLCKFSAINLRAAGPEDLNDVEITPMELADDDDLVAPTFGADSDDDDPWPNVPVEVQEKDAASQPSAPALTRTVGKAANAAKAATRRSVAVGSNPSGGVRVPPTGVRPSTTQLTRRPVSNATKGTTAGTGSAARIVSGKAATPAVARSTGLQRSIATAPGSRAVPAGAASSRSTTGVRPTTLTASRTAVRPAATTRPVTCRATVTQVTKPASQPAAPKPAATRINPKLIDFVDDELGKQTAATLERLEAEDDIEALELDLDEPIDEET